MIWTVFISLIPRKSNFILEVLKVLASMAVINTLLPWIVLPILFLFRRAPSDDVTNFLRQSQLSPLLLAFAATLLYVGAWLLFVSKTDLRDVFRQFRRIDQSSSLLSGTRSMFTSMTALIVFCGIVTFIFYGLAAKNSAYRFSPPQDFVPVADLDLSERAYSSRILTEFRLEQPAYLGVFISVRDINTSYFDLSVIGTDAFSSTVLHGEGYNAAQDGGLWKKDLPAGTYQLVVTSHQSRGKVLVYFKTYSETGE